MRHTLIAVAALIAGVSAVAAVTDDAQQSPRTLGAASGPVTMVDFAASDAKGQPITDLTPGDIAIRIDGKPRDVRELRLVKREKPAPLGTPVPDPLPPPFGSNVSAGDGPRVVFVVFDNETIAAGREQRVREGVVALINQLGPRDQAAILTVPHGGVTTDLTSDHNVLQSAAGKLMGAAPTAAETADEAACRSRLTVQSLMSVFSQRAGADTPTDVVFISSSLSGPRSNISSGMTGLGRGSVGGCQLPNDDFTQLGNAATAARARLFIVQPEQIRSGTTISGADSPLAGLENIASLTGAPIWHLAGTDEPHFQRVALETSAYYAATVVLDPADRADGVRQLSIKTTRPDVTIRTRPSIVLAGGKPGAPAPAPKDMLRTATAFKDTPLRLTAFASRNAAGDNKIKIVVMAESTSGAKFSAASIGVYDSTNKLVAQWSADAPALGAPALITAFVQNAGQYRVRVAATDTAGRGGTADYNVNATLTPAAAVLSMSALVLGTPDNNFTPKFQFTNEPQAVAYFELYGGKQGMPVSVAVELAATLNGPPLAQLQPKISASPEPDKYIITVPLAIGALAPGDYIVRAIVGLDGQPAGRIVRTLRKAQ